MLTAHRLSREVGGDIVLFASPMGNSSGITVADDIGHVQRLHATGSRPTTSWGLEGATTVFPSAIWTTFILSICTYLYLLRRRLKTPHPEARPSPLPPLEELRQTEYESIDMLKAVPKASGANYVILGGSGTAGSTIVRLLLLREDTNIRIVDLFPPPADILQGGVVEYVRADVGRADQVSEALKRPFRDGRPVDVVHNTSALIRFWDRVSYSYHVTADVNAKGPQNVVDALRSLEGDDDDDDSAPPRLLVHTSSACVMMHHPYFMRLGFGRRVPRYSDDSEPHPPHTLVDYNYAETKRRGEAIVRAADGGKGGKLRTGVLRAGMYVILNNQRLSHFQVISDGSHATGVSSDRATCTLPTV
jgi:hypothetical protein